MASITSSFETGRTPLTISLSGSNLPHERHIGNGQAVFITAEAGINHNGDIDLAHRLVEVAANSGAEAVKFQNYRTEDFLSDETLTYDYVSQGQVVVESQWDMFRRCELSSDALKELGAHCREKGVGFFSTPTGPHGVEEALEAGACLLKNGSDFLGHLDLIAEMARAPVPTILSTGMATLEEIDLAVRTFEAAGGRDLILLTCTSSYPTPAREVHLRRIEAMRAAFERPIGFSDHTDGIIAAVGATILGACLIEKHFTLDKNLPGPDHRFSSDPNELAALVSAVRTGEANLGRSRLGPTVSEEQNRQGFRLSCVVSSDLQEGHVLKREDVVFRRPGNGLSPFLAPQLLGRSLRRALSKGQLICWEFLQ